jgi:hypothetical protein
VDVPERSPLPASVASDLAVLKLRLAGMTPDDLPAADAAALGQEVGAIRLHLKRLEFEREAIERLRPAQPRD